MSVNCGKSVDYAVYTFNLFLVTLIKKVFSS